MRRTKFDIAFFILPVMFDIAIVELSMLFSYWVRFYSGALELTKGLPSSHLYSIAGWGGGAIVAIVFYLLGIYDTKRLRSIIDDVYDIAKGSLVAIVVILAPTFFFREFTFSRLTIVIASVIALGLICAEKVAIKYLKGIILKKGLGSKNAIIIGEAEAVKGVIKKLKQKPEAGYSIFGHMSPDIRENIEDVPYLGDISALRDVISSSPIDTLILTYPIHEREKVTKVLTLCQDIPVQIMLYPDPYDILTSKIEYYDVDGLTLLGLRTFELSYWSYLCKRIFDITLSSVLLLILFPLLVLVSILIKITSKGNLFYLQGRVGEQGKIFSIVKFRTMVENAEADTGPIFASPEDRRTTKIGRILRKTSIDEIPQLFNVLKGDMSLVGPRPERPSFVEQFTDEVPRYIERHKVKPGITGWAQVHGLRGNSSIKDRVRYDLYYIENWSIGLDVKIILQTIYVLFRGENAY